MNCGEKGRRAAGVHHARSPVKRAYVESFNGTLRDECLNQRTGSRVWLMRGRRSKRGATAIIGSDPTAPWPTGPPKEFPAASAALSNKGNIQSEVILMS